MEKITRIALLYDFYGNLLTEKQKEYIELYYNNDLSMGEIAEELAVSRQAVNDNLKRAEKSLEEYETKLGLIAKFQSERSGLNKIARLINEFQETGNPALIGDITQMLNKILEIENN